MRHEDKPLTVSRFLDIILAPGDPTPEADQIPTGLVADMVRSTTMLHGLDDETVIAKWNEIKPSVFRGFDGPGAPV